MSTTRDGTGGPSSEVEGDGSKKGGRRVWRAVIALFVGINVVLLLLTIGGLLARYVPPHRCWWLQVLAIALPLLAVGLLGAGLVALRGHTWWALLNLALFVLAASRVASFGFANRTDATPALTIMTFNAGGASEAPSGVDKLRDVLAAAAPDAIAWQERTVRTLPEIPGAVVGPNSFTGLLRTLGHRLPTLPTSGLGLNEPVTTSLESYGQDHVPLSDRPEQEQPGGATRAEVVWGGQRIALYSVHLKSFTRRPRPTTSTAWLRPATWKEALSAMRFTLLRQEEEVVRLRRQIEEEPLPFIVCGDLNSTPGSWAYAHLTRGLTDAFREAGTGWGGTFHTRLPLFRIDYVLASDDWEVRRARVSPVAASDHRPVVAELALRNRMGSEAQELGTTP